MDKKLNRFSKMKKVFPTLAIALLTAILANASSESWINRTTVVNPQPDAKVIRNYGEIQISQEEGDYFRFGHNLEFYNEAEGIVSASPGIAFEYYDTENSSYGKTNIVSMNYYFNEGVVFANKLRVRADKIVDSGETVSSGRGGIDIEGEDIDLWGARYFVTGGTSNPLSADGRADGVRSPEIFPGAWGRDQNNLIGGGPTVNVLSYANGASGQGHTPLGGLSSIFAEVINGANWWSDQNSKVYINETSYDGGADAKPYYQLVFVPGDSMALEFEEPDEETPEHLTRVKDCTYYNQFRVEFANAPYDNPFSPYTSQPDHGGRAVIVTQYLYQDKDEQRGYDQPRYKQIYWEDLSGYFYSEMAENGYVADSDGRGSIPDRMRVSTQSVEIPYTEFLYLPWRGEPIGGMALTPRYMVDETTGWPLYRLRNEDGSFTEVEVDPDTGEPVDPEAERIPAWIQEDGNTGRMGPYLPSVGFSCMFGYDRAAEDDDRKWLRNDFPYRFNPDSMPGAAYTTVNYSAYQATVGLNSYDKVLLAQAGMPIKPDADSSLYPGHITISGNNSVLDNLVAEAQQSITLNITNLVSAENVTLNANYVNAFFSKIKEEIDGKLPEGKEAKLTLSEVMSPQMTRLVGNVSIYSCVYNIDLEICNMTYTRNPVQEPEPEPDPEDPGDGGDTGEGGEGGADEPEWDGVSFLFHVVFVNSSTDFVPMVPYVDRFEVQTELPTEIEDTIAVGEKFRMDTPDLTLSGTFTFPVTVTDEHFVTVTNFTNYASLSTQGLNNLSGSLTNQTAPSTDFLLGWDRLDGGYENFVHMGFMNFNEVGIKSKYLEFSDGGSSQTFSSTQLEAEKLHLEAANIAAGARVELTADEMNLFDSSISAGSSILQASATGGTLTLTVNNKIDDGHSGVLSDEGVVVGVSPNKLNIRGKIEILNKPIEGDLLNTSIHIENPRISRNIWPALDLGDTLEGWTNNLAVGALFLEGSLSGNAALRFDFTPADSEIPSAIYVRDLYLGVETDLEFEPELTPDYGKMINLNGMKLYYVNCYQLEVLPLPPGEASDPDEVPVAVWVLKDTFPGSNENIIQTQNHPNWTTPVGPMSVSDMNFAISLVRTIPAEVVSASSEGMVISWNAQAGYTYTVEVSEDLGKNWRAYYLYEAKEDSTVTLDLDQGGVQKFFRLIRN